MSKSKYVVGLARTGGMDKVMAVAFSEDMVHHDVATALFGSRNRIIGAGFFDIEDREGHAPTVVTYGESVSLEVKSRPEDKHYLNALLGLASVIGMTDAVPADLMRRDYEAIAEVIRQANARLGAVLADEGFIAQEVGQQWKQAANE